MTFTRVRKRQFENTLHINKEEVEVRGVTDKLKCRIFKNGLKSDCMLGEKLGLEDPSSIIYILSKSKYYINYEENLLQ